MKNKKRTRLTRELLGLESNAELDHFLKCKDCELHSWPEGYENYCLEFLKEFRGWTPSPQRELSPLELIWQEEILRQCLPILRFEEFTINTTSRNS